MNKLSKKDLSLVTLMLFSLFFGAGNLIFPPFLGQSAGDKTWIAMSGFFITAVILPILGVIAVAKSEGLSNLASRVNKQFAIGFTILIYLSIGPCLGIPRAGSLPFEMAVAPYISQSFPIGVARIIYTFIFFSIALWLSFTPSKLVDRIGKILTPSLLILIAFLFISSIINPVGNYGQATGNYINSAFSQGFIDGYQTMDTIAALNFGIVISVAIKSRGIKNEKAVVSSSIKAGIGAGALLIIIYSILCHLGASSSGSFAMTENGAQTLTNVTTFIFGDVGAILLAVIFTLACLTTSVGLITSCSEYFSSQTKKISYKKWAIILATWSMITANLGLNKILSVSVPVLTAIYPVAIMLIVLSMLDRYFLNNTYVYKITILFTAVVSIIDALNQTGIRVGFITDLCMKLPLYSQGLCWIVPAIVGILTGIIIKGVLRREPLAA